MSIFPDIIRNLPEAGLPVAGLSVHISHANTHEVWFVTSEYPVDYPPHAHSAQWAVVLSGEIEITMHGERQSYGTGQCYYLPEGVEHSVRLSAGYAEVLFLNEPDFLGRQIAHAEES